VTPVVTQLEEKFKSLEEVLAWFWHLRIFLVLNLVRHMMVPCTWALQTCDTCDNLLQALGLVPIFCYALDSKMQLLIVTYSFYSFLWMSLLNHIFAFSLLLWHASIDWLISNEDDRRLSYRLPFTSRLEQFNDSATWRVSLNI